MAMTVRADDARVTAVCAALGPFAWKSFTADWVCRRAVAAMDGARAVPAQRGRSAQREGCVEALVELLERCRWRSLTVEGLGRLLVGAVEAWRQERAWFDIRLGLLLDGLG
ncbi:hypothetical protein AB0D08_32960 [Kitasatospora sp. NPDC048540]|uniref:hypothetical protein n=1 Tax=Kitasatospora sp. NPDC048540 TaxID=3155634 RepID=UPI0033F3FCD6